MCPENIQKQKSSERIQGEGKVFRQYLEIKGVLKKKEKQFTEEIFSEIGTCSQTVQVFRKLSKTKKSIPKVFRQKGVEQTNKNHRNFLLQKRIYSLSIQERNMFRKHKKQQNCLHFFTKKDVPRCLDRKEWGGKKLNFF